MYIPACPTCKAPLFKVKQSEHSMLSSEQFDACKAGDWYCTQCTSNATGTGFQYWWHKDLQEKDNV